MGHTYTFTCYSHPIKQLNVSRLMIDINQILYLDLLILKLKRVGGSKMVKLCWSNLPIPLLFSPNQQFDVTRLIIAIDQILYLNLVILKLKRTGVSPMIELCWSYLPNPLLFSPSQI